MFKIVYLDLDFSRSNWPSNFQNFCFSFQKCNCFEFYQDGFKMGLKPRELDYDFQGQIDLKTFV